MACVQDVAAHVLSNELIAERIWCMKLATPQANEVTPGQFFELAAASMGSGILRIPLSYSGADDSTLDIIYDVVGEGTRCLSAVQAGQTVQILGPLGRGWKLPDQADGTPLLVGGGVGIVPIMAAAAELASRGIVAQVALGAADASRLIGEEACASYGHQVAVATDNGSRGYHGLVTGLLDELAATGASYSGAYICGPTPMMAAVTHWCAERKLDAQVSLERMMGCGFGACGTCNVELVSGEYASCCKGGPVFDAAKVVW